MVTSRGTGRWVLPKGNVRKREAPHAAAAREALEEAGVTGPTDKVPVGHYLYCKLLTSGAGVRTEVQVFALAVADEHDAWPEVAERTRRWFSCEEAAAAVDEPDLAALIRNFRPA
jgi:8-oxo-dGTP pyrophosphatase MutT (NUDIX family)